MISFSTVSFSQMTFTDILKIYKMDMDQFEEYAISRGYEFYKFKKDENMNGVSYTKGVGKETKYLTLYDYYFGDRKNVNFQTSSSSELLRIKTEMKKSGYTLYESYFIKDNVKCDDYKKGVFQLSIFTGISTDENNYVTYEIGFSKNKMD
jgi:hypothetical protein